MQTEQPTEGFVPLKKPGVRLCRKTSLSLQLFITDRSMSVVLLWFSVARFWCQSFGDVLPYGCSY